jgi:hypothetical protein
MRRSLPSVCPSVCDTVSATKPSVGFSWNSVDIKIMYKRSGGCEFHEHQISYSRTSLNGASEFMGLISVFWSALDVVEVLWVLGKIGLVKTLLYLSELIMICRIFCSLCRLEQVRYRRLLQKLTDCEFHENRPNESHTLNSGVRTFAPVLPTFLGRSGRSVLLRDLRQGEPYVSYRRKWNYIKACTVKTHDSLKVRDISVSLWTVSLSTAFAVLCFGTQQLYSDKCLTLDRTKCCKPGIIIRVQSVKGWEV